MITCRLQERLFDAKIKDETKDESFSISVGKKVDRIQCLQLRWMMLVLTFNFTVRQGMTNADMIK